MKDEEEILDPIEIAFDDKFDIIANNDKIEESEKRKQLRKILKDKSKALKLLKESLFNRHD